MAADRVESPRARSVDKRNHSDMPVRERWTGEYDDFAENESEAGRHRSKDQSRSSGQREEKEHRSRDRERSKALDGVKEREADRDRLSSREADRDRLSSRDRKKEDRDEREKDKARERDGNRERHREREKDRERKDRLKEKDRERDRERDLEGSERGREKERGKEKSRDKEREKERDRHKNRERERENVKHRSKDEDEREKVKESKDKDQERAKDRDMGSRKHKDESSGKDMEKDGHLRLDSDYSRDNQSGKMRLDKFDDESASIRKQEKSEVLASGSCQSAPELEERISKMREERLKSSEGPSEVLAWVNRSRKLEDKRNAEKEKAAQLSKIFEEQDNMNDEESDDEAATQHISHDLGGVKILHGIDKVLEGGAVVLTLKDQSILADGDINQETDMLENVEIGEQKRRNEAYMAAKKKTGVYDDKFSEEPGAEKRILPQYDDPMTDEGVTLDSSGHFTGEAERKLEELRQRIRGTSAIARGEDLNSNGKISSDYYTEEEMTKFKKPKKKKSLRKKEKLDLDALEAEAISVGLGSEDLGSRNDGKRRNRREEQDKIEAEMRANAYKLAYAKAEEASKALRQEQASGIQIEEEETPVFGDDDEDLRKSLETARKIALKKQKEEEKSGPDVLIRLASTTADDSTKENPDAGSGDQPENKVVFTEMEEFVWGLQLEDDEKNPESEDVFMEEDVGPRTTSDQEMEDVDGGWSQVKETEKDKIPLKEEEKEVVPDETIHEPAVGKGIAATLKLLQDRGVLKETVEWGGRNMDKKKSKLVGINNGEEKEIRIERTDEYGRILTPKEAFRQLSHKFHGKEPGKMKQEKRMRQYEEELRVKRMKNSDTPSQSVERMREAQAKLQTPYLVLSGHVKPGQTSDPRSGFATVEKDLAGGLTPMLGDKKVEHFLNIQRKPSSNLKPKP
ncbi:U4/U6.U5 tri-snRNP-associated protein [Striga asiatica]|uniref:U4/U6.U5 tri-snRNP-associated protein n=1 Tax=Striga asiatica TaxID=4170 RepID=A0A5A7QBJ8_STRAF|nr:U4/U6.U5 tri-snRNP-associated protein [Striga asiatica]